MGDEVAEGVSLVVGDDGHSASVGEAGGDGDGVARGCVDGRRRAFGGSRRRWPLGVGGREARWAWERGWPRVPRRPSEGFRWRSATMATRCRGGRVGWRGDVGDRVAEGDGSSVGGLSVEVGDDGHSVSVGEARGAMGAGEGVAEAASSSAGGLSVVAVAAKGVGGAVAGGYGAPLGVSSSVGGLSVERAAKGVGGLGGAVSAGFVSLPGTGNGSEVSSGVERSAPDPEESEGTTRGLCRGSGPGRRGGDVAGAPGSSSGGPEGRRVEARAIRGGVGREGGGEAGGEVCARAGRAATERERHRIKTPPAAIHERTGPGARTGWVIAVPL